MAEEEKKKTKLTKPKLDKEDKKEEEVVEEKEEPKTAEEDADTASGESSDEDKTSEDTASGDEAVSQATVYADDDAAVSVEKRFSFKRLFFFIFIVFLSASVFFAGLLYYYSNSELPQIPNIDFLSKLTTQPSPTPTEAPSPSPTPQDEVVLSDYSVEVLNGSGVSGAAGAAAELLEEGGFEGIEVGNADEQDFEDTEVQMKEDVPEDVFDTIGEILDTYTVTQGDSLEEDAEFDIVIIVGQEATEEE